MSSSTPEDPLGQQIRRLLLRMPLWERLPDTKVNCGMGGDEDCRLYRHRLVRDMYKCVTTDRRGVWVCATFHRDWYDEGQEVA